MNLALPLIVLLLTGFRVYGQSDQKSLDFIIVVDEKIAVGNISSLKIHLTLEDGRDSIIRASYYPGNLAISSRDYDKIQSDETKSVYLRMNYDEISKGEQSFYHYDIELKKHWLKDYFNILRIFNLNKEKYKGLYDPIGKGLNYTFDLESPSNSFIRIQHSR